MDYGKQQQPVANSIQVAGVDAAHANEYFELFVNATSMKHILGYYRGLVDSLHLRPNVFNQFYPKLRANLTSWRAKALLKKFDSRAAHKCYLKGKVAANTRVLVIGGGPCGMRTAIEAQLLGAKVVVVEKRDRFSRNNVLHLWPFVIEDLRMLGAKKFFGKFCAGAIDHISIRQLQCILLKVALLLGIEVHTELGFESLVEPDPDKKIGWRAAFKPSNHPVSQYEFDVVIGADGKRNTLQGFSRKEFRGKLAIAITANFINKKTEAEARVEEISGVAFIFNQKFFKDLQAATRIDLENIVYYKDDTHYFVMTAKKHSLIEKGVIKQDFSDTERLLAPENVDKEALQNYAIEAANFSTNYQMPNLDFAVNHYGQPDVAMFDFTSMYAAENASKVVERHGCRLLKILVGDSLLEPFWPTGSGCARGFLSALDAAWAIRSWSMGTSSPLDTIAERESLYRLLAQTTPDNLNKDWKSYTLDPVTRYPNLNRAVVLPHQVVCLYDTDNPASIERMKRSYNEKPNEIPKKRRRGNVDNEVLLNWLKDQLKDKEEICITDMDSVFKDGKVLCAIIHHYRPDLLDYSAINSNDSAVNNQIAIDVLERDLCIPPVMTGSELTITEDYLTLATYLTEIYDCFRGEIPFIKHAKMKHASKNPKIVPLNQCIRPHVSSQYIKKIPCKKCFNAYHSKLVLYSNEMERKLLAFNHKCQSVIIPQAKKTLIKENDVEIVYKKSFNRLKSNKASMKAAKKKSISKIQLNCPQNENKCIYDSPKSSIQSFFEKRSDHSLTQIQEDIQRRCIEKIYSKHQKLKVFLTKLLLKRKKSEILKENFTTAGTQTDILTNFDLQTHLVKNNCVQTDLNEVYLRNRGNQTDTVNIINEQTDANNLDDNDERNFYDKITIPSSENRQKDKHFGKNTTEFNETVYRSRAEEPERQTLDNTATDPYSFNSFEQELSTKSLNEAGDFCQEKSKKIKKFSPTNSIEKMIKIRLLNRNLNKLTLQTIEYACYLDHLTISSKIALKNVSKRARVSRKAFRAATKLYGNSNSPSIGIASNRSESRGSLVCPFDVLSNCDYRLDSINNRVGSQTRKMIEGDGMSNQIYSRVSNWITSNDFMSQDNEKSETGSLVSNSKITDITSVSKMDRYNDIVVEERTDVVKISDSRQTKSSEEDFADKLKNIQNKTVRNLSKYSQYSPFQYCANLRSTSAPPTQFSVIVEGEEPELPPGSTKMSEVSFKTIKTASMQQQEKTQPSAPSSRHKHKHSDVILQKPGSIDRKPRKRRTMEKIGASVEERQKMLEEIASNRAERQNKRRYQRKLQTEQFLKSMQMLQANAKPDAQPFEDYSIFLYRQTAAKFEDRVKDLEKQFTYIPDHENKPYQTSRGGSRDEDIAAKIKHLENKWRQPQPVDKKPKDLMRAIGKIETSDWNIKEIEKKILENKLGKPSKAVDKEKVPKWSKEEFLARQTKMEKKHLDRQVSTDGKFADIDRNIKNLDQKLKEGTVRELGTNKVASITEKLVSKIPPEPKPPEKTVTRQPKVLPKQAASEFCHFCNKRVYLMEKLSAEGKFFHHACFKCQYCHVPLRLGSYAFDRDGLYGYRFFCLQHFGMAGEIPIAKVVRKPSVKRHSENRRSPEKRAMAGVTRVDSLEKVQTPERIEFSNLSTGNISSDQEDSINQMDEDEWTDKNFGGSCAEFDDTDEESSSLSESDSDDEEAYGDALEEPATKEGTLKWAERWKNSYSQRRNSDSAEYASSSSDQSSYYDSSDDDESDTATEGEEEIRARELRKQEVCVEPPIVHTDTGTDTEVVSDESSSESSNAVHNSATEISTDSEFAQDDPTPTRELPFLNDFNVTKTRGSGGNHVPKRIQVTSRYLQKASDGKSKKPNIELKLTPLVPSSAQQVKKPAPIALSRPEGYVLNRTQSTGGIAAKVSLELKKRYLLGEPNPGSIQKSGSASTLDTKFKSFHTNISDCQKMLKPSTEISASMQTFCKKMNELKSPVSPPPTLILTKEIDETTLKQKDDPLKEPEVVDYDSDIRPRSPLHETFIVVPKIDWSKRKDSITSDSLASSDSDVEKPFENIPTIQIYTAPESEQHKDEFIADSLQYFVEDKPKNPSIESPKSITSEKKTLNQPKTLPNLENLLPEIHNSLHIKYKDLDITKDASEPVKNNSSALSSPESLLEQVTTALTESELSDWARDEMVSDDFEDGEFEISFKPSDKCEKKILNQEDKVILTEGMHSILSGNLDNIEFMDTGTETSSDDGIVNSQNGYVLFKNDDEFATDSLNPHINDVTEAKNVVVDFKTVTASVTVEQDKAKLVVTNTEPDDDSVIIIESGTTTEDNTFTDSTVKNVEDFSKDTLILTENNNVNEHKNKNTDTDTTIVEDVVEKDNNLEYEEHCQRLTSKIEFSNARDSINVRKAKSRRKSKPDVLQKPDLITEEIPSPISSPKILSAKFNSPDIIYNKDVIKKERDTNQKLIQEMVMNKMKAENKSLERRKRNKQNFEINKSASSIVVGTSYNCNQGTSRRSLFQDNSKPDVLLTTNLKSANGDFIKNEASNSSRPRQHLEASNEKTKTPEEMNRKLEKLKETIRLRKQENEQMLLNKDQRNANISSNSSKKMERPVRRCTSGDYDTPPDQDSLKKKAKSISYFPDKLTSGQPISIDQNKNKMYRSDPNILGLDEDKNKRKSQEKKGLTKFFSGFFTKKSPTGGSKGLFSKLSPKSKEISKEPVIFYQRKSTSEGFIHRNVTPPPVPPLPINYSKKTDDSSDAEDGPKKQNDSSCDTLDCTGISVGSTACRRSSKSLRAIRQAQVKRHRMAQEIQRKLEETEVKTKELEERGVQVEKALRGEGSGDSSKDEPELLQEWFDLMRDRTELRRYERELTVRGQELELEDRHARLQHELRERIENDRPKTVEDVDIEKSIINEMIQIVDKRDSLITEIEEDKIRYSHEDKDLEEQMLAKGLILTPVKKSPVH